MRVAKKSAATAARAHYVAAPASSADSFKAEPFASRSNKVPWVTGLKVR